MRLEGGLGFEVPANSVPQHGRNFKSTTLMQGGVGALSMSAETRNCGVKNVLRRVVACAFVGAVLN